MSNPNVNCLTGMRCPNKNCGSYGPFYISVKVIMAVSDDGTDPIGDEEWGSNSSCDCQMCNHSGIVANFKDPEVKE